MAMLNNQMVIPCVFIFTWQCLTVTIHPLLPWSILVPHHHGTMYLAWPCTARAAWPQRRLKCNSAAGPLLYPVEELPAPCYGACGHGGRRTQGFLAVGQLEEDLLDYLRNDSWFDPRNLGNWGFQTDRKEPFLSKADWHTFPQLHDFVGLVPRLGKAAPLRRAPQRCLAFAESLRRRISCSISGAVAGEEGRWLGTAVATGRFGAVEAQVQLVDDTWQFMRSHRDGASGLLQLGLTLQGSRYLRLGCHGNATSADSPQNVWDKDGWKGGDGSLITLPLTAGQVYLATPAVLEHGVAYEPRGATVALMFRLALPDSAVAEEVNRCQCEAFHLLAGKVARQLQHALDEQRLHLPSLADVKQAELEMEKVTRPPKAPGIRNWYVWICMGYRCLAPSAVKVWAGNMSDGEDYAFDNTTLTILPGKGGTVTAAFDYLWSLSCRDYLEVVAQGCSKRYWKENPNVDWEENPKVEYCLMVSCFKKQITPVNLDVTILQLGT